MAEYWVLDSASAIELSGPYSQPPSEVALREIARHNDCTAVEVVISDGSSQMKVSELHLP